MRLLSCRQQLESDDQTLRSEDPGGRGEGQVELDGAGGEGLHQGEPHEADGQRDGAHYSRAFIH